MIDGSETAIGHNPGINESEQIGKTVGDKSFEGKIAAPAVTDHKKPPSGKPAADVEEQRGHAADVAERRGQEQHASGRAAATSHEDEKAALIAAAGRGWPSGALVGVSLASPLRPREEAPPRR